MRTALVIIALVAATMPVAPAAATRLDTAAAGCTTTWVGPTSGYPTSSWFTASYWSRHAVPDRTDDVCLPTSGDGYVVLIEGARAFARSITIGDAPGTLFDMVTLRISGAQGPAQLSLHGTGSTIYGEGAITLQPGDAGSATVSGPQALTVAGGGRLRTRGDDDAAPAYVRVPVTVQAGGRLSFGASTTYQDAGTATVNDGAADIGYDSPYWPARLHLRHGSTFVNGSAAILATNLTYAPVTVSVIDGRGLTAAGTLAVGGYSNPVGTALVPFPGPVSGTFDSFSFGPKAFVVDYPRAAVRLTGAPAFTLDAVPQPDADEDLATGPRQVAILHNYSAGTGTYRASVDWGDRSPAQEVTLGGSGEDRPITAPSHTYTVGGTYQVNVLVANSNGTSVSTFTTIKVQQSRIDRLKPASGSVAGGNTVTIQGHGFTGASAVTFGGVAAGSFRIVDDFRIKAVAPAHPAGEVNVAVTTPSRTTDEHPWTHYTYAP